MPITEHESGSKTLTSNATEYVLNTTTPETTDGVFVLVLDTSDIASGETVVVKVKEKARSGDTQRLLDTATVVNVQGSPLWMSPSYLLLHGWDVSLTQSVGSGAVILWSIRKVA